MKVTVMIYSVYLSHGANNTSHLSESFFSNRALVIKTTNLTQR